MSSLLELLLKTDNNGFAGKIAEQYGLDQNQANSALQALMPAFSQGLKRNVGSAQGFGAFMQALAEGNHTQYNNDPAQAFTQDGINEGNQILGHLFKSKDLSRKIAEHASINSGVSTNTLKQMLPSLAPLILGALTKNMQNQNASQSDAQHFGGGGANPLGRILEELMKGGLSGAGGRQPSGPRGKKSGNNPLGDILEQMMGRKGGFGSPNGGQNRQAEQSSRNDRLSDIFGEMLDGKTDHSGNFNDPEIQDNNYQDNNYQDNKYEAPYPDADVNSDPYADAPMPEKRPDNQTRPQRRPRGGGLEDLFGDMFRPSSQDDTKYGRDVDSIFDEFLGPDNR